MSSARRHAQPPADLSQYLRRPAEYRSFLRADLRCYLCGDTLGSLEAPYGSAVPRVALFRATGSFIARRVEWRRLRCGRCGSNGFLDDVETVRERIDDWRLDQPRRGRPPKWLLELRETDAA